jgi:hypothetical protein
MRKTKQGGLDPTSPTTKLNMWACTYWWNLRLCSISWSFFYGVVVDSKYFGLSGSGASHTT